MTLHPRFPNGHDRTSRQGSPSPERGIALIMVIWVLTFFSIVLSAFAFSMRTEMHAARNFKEEAEASSLAEAGIARAVAELANAGVREDMTPRVPPYSSGDIPLGRGKYRVSVTDEGSRIPLNQASEEVWRRLLRNTGVRDSGLLDTLADSILDWRDPDSLQRSSGAEEAYYLSLSQPYHPRNGDLEFLEELLLVKGMTREIFFGNVADPERLAALLGTSPEERDLQPGEYLGIRPFLTTRGSGQVNVNTASLDTLVALGLSGSEAVKILENRRPGPIRGQIPQAGRGLPLTTASGTYRIESTGSLPGAPVAYRITAIVQKEGTPARPRIRVLSWKEGS